MAKAIRKYFHRGKINFVKCYNLNMNSKLNPKKMQGYPKKIRMKPKKSLRLRKNLPAGNLQRRLP
jgi:hypothetical protein